MNRNTETNGEHCAMSSFLKLISFFNAALFVVIVAPHDASAFVPTTIMTCSDKLHNRHQRDMVLSGSRINDDMSPVKDSLIRNIQHTDDHFNNIVVPNETSRRQLICRSMGSVASAVFVLSSLNIETSNALVKGNAPPSASNKSEKLKCTNVEECQEMAERREQQLREQQDKEAAESSTTIATTKRGTRYRDILSDSSGSENAKDKAAKTVKEGDEVTMYYKVLKLGKRSYDGLSGEGTVVFSCGYGLEDDEKSARTKTFTTTIGNMNNIVALNDGIIGMPINAIRRIQVLPERGWRKPDAYCDGGPGGSGTGGNLKTDYVVVPTATMVATETCFDTTKLPFPAQSYAEQRRMAQRFDQSLILEVEVIDITRAT